MLQTYSEPLTMLLDAGLLKPADLDEALDRGAMVTLREFGYSDYSGAAYDRSNIRSLVRDFPGDLSTVNGDFYSVMLTLNPMTTDTELAKTLIGLVRDYPVYDEDDLSALENDMAEESWDSLAGDINRAIEEWGLDLSGYELSPVMYGLFADAYNATTNDAGYAETAVSYVWPHSTDDNVIEALINRICDYLSPEIVAPKQTALAL